MITDIEILKKDLVVIENVENFKVKIPNLHPDHPQYNQVWKKYFQYCIEGLWVYDNGGWRFMPPTLFFYVNFFKIQQTKAEKKVRRSMKPLLRDLDWMIHYAYLEAQGFSGYKNDPDNSCDIALIDDYTFNRVRDSEDPDARIRFNDLHKTDGKRKTYFNPRQYLKQLHSQDLGKPLYANPSQNLMIFGCRGGGKSFSVSGIGAHTLTFDGAKEYTRKSLEEPTIAAIAIGAGITDKSSELVSKIVDGLNALGIDSDLGVYGTPESDIYEPNPFWRSWVGDAKPGNKKNPFRYEYEVETPKGWVVKGSKTSMFHINYSDKKQDGTQAGAGGRYLLSVYEEIGLMPNFRDALLSNKATVSDEGTQFGVQIAIGTAGNIDLVQQTKLVFENPSEYNFLEYENIWEPSEKKIGLFLPAYLTDSDSKDKNGNTDIEKALKVFEKNRLEAAAKDDPAILYNEKMNSPLVPSDMWISNKGSFFPQIEFMEREKELLKDQLFKQLAQPTKLIWDSKQPNEVRAEYCEDTELFHTFPYERTLTKPDGGIAIYEKPQTIRGEVPNDMYIFTYDPYVSENIDEGGSLGVTLGFLNPKYTSQGFNGNLLVCSYIGKHPNGKDAYYENQEKLLAYYGNPHRGLWYEANRGDSVRGYYMRKKKMHLLALRPNKEKGSQIFQNRVLEYGFTVGNQIDKLEMIDDAAEWSLSKTNFNDKSVRVVETIPCLFLVQQIIQFHLKGNFDAVSALLGYPLALKELEHEVLKERNKPKHNPLAAISMNPNIFKESDTLARIKQLNERIKNET
jgi:hypothetical protein